MGNNDNKIKSNGAALNTHYVKFSCENFQSILDTLTPTECKIIMLLSSYISYKDCVLRKGGNTQVHVLDVMELSDLLESNYHTFRKIIYSLRNKGVLYIDKYSDEKKIIMNPFLVCKGSTVDSDVIDLFKDTNWSGQVSSVADINNDFSSLFRSLILDWKKESMIFCDYKCIVTGEKFDDVHHPYPFRKIIIETFDKLNMPSFGSPKDYDDLLIEKIKNTFMEVHNMYGIGMCLCRKVHNLFHKEYGYINFKYDDFLIFIDDVMGGKYMDYFEENGLQTCINKQAVTYLKSIATLISKNKE